MDQVLRFLATGAADAPLYAVIGYTLLSTHLTIVAVTVYLHRHQAHHALTLHPLIGHLFRFWLWLTTGMVTREWVAVHRKHHACCEQVGDPHSPRIVGLRAVLLRGAELYRTASRDREVVARYGKGCPDDWIERHLYSRWTWQGVGLLLVADVALFGILGLAVWGIQMLWIPVLAAGVVNGVGHAIGYRNFDCREAAVNIVPLGLLIGGEELHNNHHAYPCSAKMSVKWYEFDLGWLYIRTLALLGLAQVRPVPLAPRTRPSCQDVDERTLHAVLGNRAHVMATLSARLAPVLRQEIRSMSLAGVLNRRAALRLLRRDPGYLSADETAMLGSVLAANGRLRDIQALRVQLTQVWQRSLETEDGLFRMLAEWCTRASRAECAQLRRFAGELRAYA
ncbi:DesA family fatty acid desaturase [Massilia niastensis]|uniref:DesA family fatty acid desaturase n=1 Tax=Massilia niastensis TaxID=544911 RepID=UPI00037F8BD2|nr:fatty acid desaturase [Massilia niastensis]